jgi:hypothetical protein
MNDDKLAESIISHVKRKDWPLFADRIQAVCPVCGPVPIIEVRLDERHERNEIDSQGASLWWICGQVQWTLVQPQRYLKRVASLAADRKEQK